MPEYNDFRSQTLTQQQYHQLIIQSYYLSANLPIYLSIASKHAPEGSALAQGLSNISSRFAELSTLAVLDLAQLKVGLTNPTVQTLSMCEAVRETACNDDPWRMLSLPFVIVDLVNKLELNTLLPTVAAKSRKMMTAVSKLKIKIDPILNEIVDQLDENQVQKLEHQTDWLADFYQDFIDAAIYETGETNYPRLVA